MGALAIVDTVLFSLLIFIGTVGNAGFLYIIYKSQKLKTFQNALHINLALFDTLAIILGGARKAIPDICIGCSPHHEQMAVIVSKRYGFH